MPKDIIQTGPNEWMQYDSEDFSLLRKREPTYRHEIEVLPPGETIQMASFEQTMLSKIAATLGVSYEDMCKDFDAGVRPHKAEIERYDREMEAWRKRVQKRMQAQVYAPILLDLTLDVMGLGRGMCP